MSRNLVNDTPNGDATQAVQYFAMISPPRNICDPELMNILGNGLSPENRFSRDLWRSDTSGPQFGSGRRVAAFAAAVYGGGACGEVQNRFDLLA